MYFVHFFRASVGKLSSHSSSGTLPSSSRKSTISVWGTR